MDNYTPISAVQLRQAWRFASDEVSKTYPAIALSPAVVVSRELQDAMNRILSKGSLIKNYLYGDITITANKRRQEATDIEIESIVTKAYDTPFWVDGKGYGYTDFAKAFNILGDYKTLRNKILEQLAKDELTGFNISLRAMLAGMFDTGAGVLRGNISDIYRAAGPTSANRISYSAMTSAVAAVFGERLQATVENLGAIICHPDVWANLTAGDLSVVDRQNSQSLRKLTFYGIPVFLDSTLAQDGQDGAPKKYTTYVLGRGVIEKGTRELSAAPDDLARIAEVGNAQNGTLGIVKSWATAIAVKGISYVGTGIPDSGPTDVQLATPANWSAVTDPATIDALAIISNG